MTFTVFDKYLAQGIVRLFGIIAIINQVPVASLIKGCIMIAISAAIMTSDISHII
ncbi:hypothetical protein ACTQ3A_05010 [Bilifractor sp. LCP21S3_F8]|uniref:hypothetical protein n=1 Tax=Bilifractor sp. LCP21S3_F8 TaxID=3438744 RepID=UPI003F902F83